MTTYLVSSDEWGTVYHESSDGETPDCNSDGIFREAQPGEIANRTLCQHCSGEATYHGEYVPDMGEKLLTRVEDSWQTPRALSEHIEATPQTIRRRLNKLYENDRVNRRFAAADRAGRSGYEFSQLEPDTADGYEGNKRLFESMFGD